jgi:hypothetical protein
VFRVLCSVLGVLCSVFCVPGSAFRVSCSVFCVRCSVFCVPCSGSLSFIPYPLSLLAMPLALPVLSWNLFTLLQLTYYFIEIPASPPAPSPKERGKAIDHQFLYFILYLPENCLLFYSLLKYYLYFFYVLTPYLCPLSFVLCLLPLASRSSFLISIFRAKIRYKIQMIKF